MSEEIGKGSRVREHGGMRRSTRVMRTGTPLYSEVRLLKVSKERHRSSKERI
jgi:hypothetical protein